MAKINVSIELCYQKIDRARLSESCGEARG